MRYLTVWLVGTIVIGLWSAWLTQHYLFGLFGFDWNVQTLGPWGDTFGAISSLFSALGFIAVVTTLIIQQEQIKQARIDQDRINLSNKEDQYRQRFEASFFQLLGLFRETKNDVVFHYTKEYDSEHNLKDAEYIGGMAFRAAWNEIGAAILKKKPKPDAAEAGMIYYNIFHKRYESRISSYFRLLYTILNWIKNDKILDESEKIRYANLLRSQLTAYELVIIGLNGLSIVSNDLKDLIIDFRILKYVPPGARRQILKRYYPNEAFEPRD